MTIHKAKGLEFKIVIVPFCNWNLDHEPGIRKNVLWCKTANKPFDLLPFVPVNYSADLKNTYFSKEYQTERMHALVDNLNLLYVALTRAREELYIFSTPSKPKDDQKNIRHIGDMLLQALNNNDLSAQENWKKLSKDESLIYEYGQPGRSETFVKDLDEPVLFNFYPVTSISKNLKIKYHGSGHFVVKEDQSVNIDYGIVMHEILSRINSREDIPFSVERSVNEGKIDNNDKNEIIRLLDNGFDAAVPPEFFSPGWKIYNERDILTTHGNYRPDRIMLRENSAIIIDFKFGMEIKTVYISQLTNYLKLIKETGYEHVRGYVWYFTLGRTEEVSYER
jgi:hypothetical protein